MIHFTPEAWDHYLYWQEIDKAILKKINLLIRDCVRDPFGGLGKPEPLKGNLSGYLSRRIDDEHRLVYKYEKLELVILSCRFHYVKIASSQKTCSGYRCRNLKSIGSSGHFQIGRVDAALRHTLGL